MLKKLFGSSKASARAASHTQFIYLSHDLQKVRAELGAFVLGDGGVALVSGQHGIGKTFLLQLLANDLESGRAARRVISLSCNFGFSGGDLVRRVCEKLGARHAASAAADEDSHLHRCLLEGVGKDGLTILLVDEAQNLGDAELERFLGLTDLHAGSASDLRIVVAGRPGVEAAFTRAARRYRRRHVWNYRLQPLQRQEIAPFIAAWLRAQGRKRDNRLFTPEAVERIARRSCGVPGAVIDLCATALLLAAENGRQPLSADDIDDAADYLQIDQQPSAPLVDDSEPEEDDRESEIEIEVGIEDVDHIDDIDDVEEDVEHAPLPSLSRAVPPRTEERVILPFASEPARAEGPRRRFPVRARPASLEKALPKEPPAPKRVISLEPAEPASHERISPRFTARDPDDMFVAGPRPSATPMRDFRPRRKSRAGRVAVGIALAGSLLLLPVLWDKLTDRSPMELATALLQSDSPLPGAGAAGPSLPAPTTADGRETGDVASAPIGDLSRPLAKVEPTPAPGARPTAPVTAAPDMAPPAPVERADATEPPPLPMGREEPTAESRIAEAAPSQSEPPGAAAPAPTRDSMPAPEAVPTPAEPRQATVPIPAPEQPKAEQPAQVAETTPTPEPAEPAAAPAPAPAPPEQPAAQPAAPVETAVAEPAPAAPAPDSTEDGGEEAAPSESDTAAASSGGQLATAEEATSPPAASPAEPPSQTTAEAPTEKQTEEQAAPAEPSLIATLLARARGQIEDYALTTPKGDNALETYQQVLRLAPGHPQALQGIRDVAETYLRLATAAERSGDMARTQRYREKAAEIAPDHPMVLAMQRTRTQAAAPSSGAAQASAPEAAPPEDRAGQVAAASGIIQRLQERFGVAAPASPPPGDAATAAPEPRQTAAPPAPVRAVRQPAQPPRAAPRQPIRQPTGPMSLAAFNQPNGVEMAVSEGRDVNTRFSDGRTPLIIAAARGESDRVKLLLANGAEPNAATGDAATALMYAAWNGDAASTEALLQYGASPNARNLDGKTALMAAATNGHTAAAEALLRHGGDVDAQASNGWTALMYAAWTGKIDVARLLLERNANPAITNGDGDTAAALAAERGYAALADMLSGRRVVGERSTPGVRTANRGGGPADSGATPR